MAGTVLVPLPFSAVPFIRLLTETGQVPDDTQISISVALKPKRLLKALKETVEEFVETRALPQGKSLRDRAADSSSITRMEDYLKGMGFTITDSSAEKRHVQADGTAKQVTNAFGVVLNNYSAMETDFYGHDGPVMVPANWIGHVEQVLGLNNFPVLNAQFHKFLEQQEETDPYVYPAVDECDPPKHFTIDEIKKIFNWPEQSRGRGQRIAIISLGGGFYQEDLEKYWSGLGLQPPGTAGGQCWPEVKVFGNNDPASKEDMTTYLEQLNNGEQLTGTNSEITQRSWTLEITMDIEIMGAMANDATLEVYFVDSANPMNFYNLINSFKDSKPDVVSGSFAVAEATIPKPTLDALNNAFENCAAEGIDFCFAAGNYGAYPTSILGKKVLTPGFPSSSQYVTGCGGVLMRWRDGDLVRPVFNQLYGDKYPMASGGGLSTHFKAMPWQKKALPGVKERACPDICMTTDLKTSPLILVSDMEFESGGTSAATVYWAALKARLRSALGNKRPATMPIGPLLWQEEARETMGKCIKGNSCIPPSDEGEYQAEPTFAYCTGWGWPNGDELYEALEKILDEIEDKD